MSKHHEEALIGLAQRHQGVFDRPDFPPPGAFDDPLHREAVKAFSMIRSRNLDINPITIQDAVPGLVMRLSGGNYSSVSPGNEEYYIREVKKDACRRAIAQMAPWLLDRAEDDPNDTLEKLKHKIEVLQSESSDMANVQGRLIEDLLESEFTGVQEEMIPTGLTLLDELLEGGFPLGGYIVGTGPTGHGKSTLAGQMVLNWVCRGRKVWFGSFEMAPGRMSKILMVQAGLCPVRENIEQFKMQYTKGNLYMSGTLGVLDPDAMAREIRHFIARGVKIFVIDNLTVMEALESGERNEKQIRLMQQILQMAMEHRVLFLVLAHLRKGTAGKPTSEDISGASAIGQLSEVCWSIMKKEKDADPDARLTLLKTRTHGMGRSIRMTFNAHNRSYAEARG